ncbi:MAG: nitroreductase family protein [Planctomycetota bacterium]
MQLRETMLGRRTVHAYTPDPLPEGAIDRALEAAIHAPNHRLTWPWRFTRVGRETRVSIAERALALKAAKNGGALPKEVEERSRAKILNPAELVVVSLVRCEDPFVAREDYASASCAIQNLTLSLWAEGVATKWSSGGLTTKPETYQDLQIDPEEQEIIGFLWCGIAAKVPPKPERPSLDSLVRELP